MKSGTFTITASTEAPTLSPQVRPAVGKTFDAVLGGVLMVVALGVLVLLGQTLISHP